MGLRIATWVSAVVMLAACDGGGDPTVDGGRDAGPIDAAAVDAGERIDAAVPIDAAPIDAAPTDAAPIDAGEPLDAAARVDAAPLDAGLTDAGPPDAGCDGDGDGHDGPGCGGGDCDDADPSVHPGATEICNGANDDCDDATDEGARLTFYVDADGDGYGDPDGETTAGCAPPSGFSASATDCDDTYALIHPGAGAPCDCVAPALYDSDGDTHVSLECGGDDCHDGDDTIYPGAPELCDRVDNDCSSGGLVEPSEDFDEDGHAPSDASCSGGLARDDCDDMRGATHPSATEICNGLDDDCAGGADDGADASCTIANGTAACDAGSCELVACDLGYVASGSACVASLAPRPIAPLSGATVSIRRPALRWELAAGTDGARVELCADRACASPIATLDVMGTSATPASDLPPGVVFWRLRGRSGDTLDDGVSATWQLTVLARSAPVSSAWGSILDVNGDGYADVAVAAPEEGAGLVHLYHGGPSGPASTPTTTLVGPGGTNGLFGAGVGSADVDGDGYSDLLVGATQVASDMGRVYVYSGGPSGLTSTPSAIIAAPEGNPMLGNLAFFGAPIASAGDVDGDGYGDVVIAAPEVNVGFDEGRAYVYRGGPSGLSAAPSAMLGPLTGDSGFGIAVVGCDVDADGFTDIVAGSDIRSSDDGRFSVYSGGAGGVASTATITVRDLGGELGSALACADVDGDGYPDLAVGAPDASSVQLFAGGASGIGASASATILAPTSSDFAFGQALGAGDVDGDGYADLAVGAPDASNGRVFVYAGGASGSSSTPASTIDESVSFAHLGWSVSGGGDVNGDGYADLVAGAPSAGGGRGAAEVFFGSAIGLPAAPSITLPGTLDDAEHGTVVLE